MDGKFLEMDVHIKWFSMLLPASGSHQIFNRCWKSLETWRNCQKWRRFFLNDDQIDSSDIQKKMLQMMLLDLILVFWILLQERESRTAWNEEAGVQKSQTSDLTTSWSTPRRFPEQARSWLLKSQKVLTEMVSLKLSDVWSASDPDDPQSLVVF